MEYHINNVVSKGTSAPVDLSSWQQPTTTFIYQYPYVDPFSIKLRKVENGWILMKDGKEYILTKPEQIVKYLQE